MTTDRFDAIVIGAGHAGLAAAEHLSRRGLRFVVLERGEIGETWRKQRWDSFVLNTPAWANALPGLDFDGEREAFPSGRDFVAYLERYGARFGDHIRRGATVVAVRRASAGDGLAVSLANGETLSAKNVVVASGIQNVPKLPKAPREIPAGVTAIDASGYRAPEQIPAGAVLIVGSAQTGCQIAEELVAAGRRVFLSTSRVGRMPRRHRGRDVFEWQVESGVQDERVAGLPHPSFRHAPPLQVSGVGPRGHTVSLQALAAAGTTLLGRMTSIAGGVVRCADDLSTNAKTGDDTSKRVRENIDAFIARSGMVAPPSEPDPADEPDPALWEAHAPTAVDLGAEGISTIVYCTGFSGDFSWIDGVGVDARGEPAHDHGASKVLPGLYFLGFPWLSRRKSGLIYGIDADAARVITDLTAR